MECKASLLRCTSFNTLISTSQQYPVITAHQARREDWLHRDPGLLTTSTNRNLFQPTKDNKARRRSEIREEIRKGKTRSTSSAESSSRQPGAIEAKLKRNRSTSTSGKSDRSQLVDLVVEDTEAEEAERVRARKEGGDTWNRSPQRHFVRTYSIDEEAPEGQDIRQGWDPSKVAPKHPPPEKAVSDEENDDDEGQSSGQNGRYGSMIEDDNVWGRN